MYLIYPHNEVYNFFARLTFVKIMKRIEKVDHSKISIYFYHKISKFQYRFFQGYGEDFKRIRDSYIFNITKQYKAFLKLPPTFIRKIEGFFERGPDPTYIESFWVNRPEKNHVDIAILFIKIHEFFEILPIFSMEIKNNAIFSSEFDFRTGILF